jgi:hypothetical protein
MLLVWSVRKATIEMNGSNAGGYQQLVQTIGAALAERCHMANLG